METAHWALAHEVCALDMLRGQTSPFKQAIRFQSECPEVLIIEDITQFFQLVGDIKLNVELCGCRRDILIQGKMANMRCGMQSIMNVWEQMGSEENAEVGWEFT
jgi:hypothetical protein